MNRISLALATGLLALCNAAGAADSIYLASPGSMIQKVSAAVSAHDYKLDVARHFYEAYAARIFKGRLPPLIHGVVVVETTVDAFGQPRDIKLVRGPSHAPDVSAAVVEMIRRASPLPAPSRFAAGGLKFTEVWLVHKDGRFQLDSLTEGQD